MKSEHEHFMRCKMCPKNSAIYEKASNAVIDSLMSICHEFKSGYTNNLKALHKNLELQLLKIPKTAESDIVAIKLHTIEYIIELNQWSGYLRGEKPEKPSNIKYSERYQLDIGEWVKCTILPYMLNPLKNIIKTLPKLNAPTRTYPLNELQEMFMHIEAMIGMMNYCEEEESSPEGSYLGFAVLAVDQLQRLVCPKEIRPGHVILECQRIAQAYAEFFKRMCNAAWALGFKVENRDRNEIDLEDELSKVIPPVKTSTSKESIAAQLPSQSTTIQESAYANPVANEIINDPGCELFNDTERMRLTGESIVDFCENLSIRHLHKKEFSVVSRNSSLYRFWVMAEGAREIKEIWKLTPFYLGKTDTLPKRTKLLSKYLDWNCNYSFWQAIDKFYRSAIQGDVKYNDSDITMIHYLGIVYGKSIKLINSLHGRWLEFDLNKLGNHLYALLQSESNDKEFLHDLVLQELDVIKKWVGILHDELPEFELARLRGEMPTQSHKESECITMFPFEKKFKLIGLPNFIVPEDKQVALGRQLEKIAKAQEFKFKETTFSAPKYTSGNCDFEYRIQDKIDPDSDHYTIYFNYFKSDNTLRVYSCIPAARTMPIVKFIVENYLHVHLGKEISTSYGLDSIPVVSETPQPTIKFQKRLYCERFKVSKDFKYIYDSVHTIDNYPLIQNLENTGNKVIEVLKKLFNSYGKKTTSGWVYSGGGAWGPHFAKKPYSLFKSQQISVRRNPDTNEHEWRIVPLAEFDEQSPIGLHSKHKNHSNLKNNF